MEIFPTLGDSSCRSDALFQVLQGLAPDRERPLASTSTLNRFLYGYTRRDAQLPREERPSLLPQRRAQLQRLRICNDFLVDLFLRTRGNPPGQVILDLDATEDPVHGHQPLSGYHGYYRQHQYLPLLIFEGQTGFPLACWLRPGTLHAACGAVDVLKRLVDRLRQAWPGVDIRQRGGVPEQPIGELKNGLKADRLSSCGFCANALKRLVAVVAYALVVLDREACAGVEGVGHADVQSLRDGLWKVPAELVQGAGGVRLSLPGDWPYRQTWEQTLQAVRRHAERLAELGQPPGPPGAPGQPA